MRWTGRTSSRFREHGHRVFLSLGCTGGLCGVDLRWPVPLLGSCPEGVPAVTTPHHIAFLGTRWIVLFSLSNRTQLQGTHQQLAGNGPDSENRHAWASSMDHSPIWFLATKRHAASGRTTSAAYSARCCFQVPAASLVSDLVIPSVRSITSCKRECTGSIVFGHGRTST
jgi:hypothetical protein